MKEVSDREKRDKGSADSSREERDNNGFAVLLWGRMPYNY